MSDHATDEQLSAHLDGEAPADERASVAAHLESCPRCRDRLGELEAVAAAVAEPVPVPSATRRDAAVAAAATAWAEEATPAAEVVPLRRRALAWGAAAAAVAAVLVGASVLVFSDGAGPVDTTAAPPGDADRRADRGAGGPAAAMITDGGDLGDQSDPQALAQTVEAALRARAGPSAGGGAARDSASARAGEPEAGVAPATGGDRRLCAVASTPVLGEASADLVYTASLRWQGTPALLLAYRLSGPGPPVAGEGLRHRVVVMAQADCRLLVVQSF